MGINYTKQYVLDWGSSFMVIDAYLHDSGIAIELDGLHHLLDTYQVALDAARDDYLRVVYGVRVVRMINAAVFDKRIKKIIGELVSPLRQSTL